MSELLRGALNDHGLLSRWLAGVAMAAIVLDMPLAHLAGIAIVVATVLVLATIGFHNQELLAPLVIAFVARAFVAVCFTAFPGLDPDPDGYGLRAVEWAMHGTGGVLGHFTTGAYMYSWLISLLYATTGESEFAVRMFNVFIGVLVVWCTYVLTLQLWRSRRIALASAWVAAIFPNMVRFSASFPSREALITLFFMAGTISLIAWVRNQKFRHFVGSVVGFSVSVALHTGMAVGLLVAAIVVTAMLLKSLLQRRPQTFVRAAAAGLVLVLGFWLILVSGWGLDKIGQELVPIAVLHRLAGLGEQAAFGRAAYLHGLEMNSVMDVAWVLPLRVVYFLFAPFLWMVRTPLDMLGLADALLYIALMLGIIRARGHIIGNALARNVLLLAAVAIVLFAAATSNYGTAIRHRAKIAPLLISLAVVVPLRRYRRLRVENIGDQYATGS